MNNEVITRQAEIDIVRDLTAAIRSGNPFDKVANKFSDILAVGGYMYGAARQIYGALADGQFHTLTGADIDKIKIENENERIRIEMPVQPDIEEFIGETQPRKLLGEGYLSTANGRFVSGYLTTLKTPIIGKSLDLIEIYPYDFVKEMKDSRHLSIFKKEDRYWFYGCYSVISEMEALVPGASIAVCDFKSEWERAPHKQIIDLLKLHGSPVKRNQPRELLVLPEDLYLDFGKIDHFIVNNMAGDFLKSGFSPNDSPLYSLRKLMLRDSRGLTFDPNVDKRTLFSVTDKEAGYNPVLKFYKLLLTFGYNIPTPEADIPNPDFDPSQPEGPSNPRTIPNPAAAGLQKFATKAAADAAADDMETSAEYIFDALKKNYGSLFNFDWEGTGAVKALDIIGQASFERILVYSPLNYLGRVYLWNRDVKNNIEVKNDYVSTWSDEKITYMFHNIFAVTALDIWTLIK